MKDQTVMLVLVREVALAGHHGLDLVILVDSILLQIMTEGNHLQVRVLANLEVVSPEAVPEAAVLVVQEAVVSAVPMALAEADQGVVVLAVEHLEVVASVGRLQVNPEAVKLAVVNHVAIPVVELLEAVASAAREAAVLVVPVAELLEAVVSAQVVADHEAVALVERLQVNLEAVSLAVVKPEVVSHAGIPVVELLEAVASAAREAAVLVVPVVELPEAVVSAQAEVDHEAVALVAHPQASPVVVNPEAELEVAASAALVMLMVAVPAEVDHEVVLVAELKVVALVETLENQKVLQVVHPQQEVLLLVVQKTVHQVNVLLVKLG